MGNVFSIQPFMRKKFHHFFLLLLLASSTIAIGQPSVSNSITLSGNILDGETNDGLAGVNIVIKGTVLGTVTDLQGDFQLKTKSLPVTIVASFVGYKSQEIEVTDAGSPIKLTLVPGALLGEEVVVTASRMEESELKSPVAIEKLDIRAIKETPAPSFYDALENVKGVQVLTSSLRCP
jgi:iron complex outermembrane recepter protein